MLVAAVLVVALVFSSPQEVEGSLLDDFLVSADKATAFFPGAHAQDTATTAAEAAEEAADDATKTQAELDRESTKTVDEAADEVAEAASDEL